MASASPASLAVPTIPRRIQKTGTPQTESASCYLVDAKTPTRASCTKIAWKIVCSAVSHAADWTASGVRAVGKQLAVVSSVPGEIFQSAPKSIFPSRAVLLFSLLNPSVMAQNNTDPIKDGVLKLKDESLSTIGEIRSLLYPTTNGSDLTLFSDPTLNALSKQTDDILAMLVRSIQNYCGANIPWDSISEVTQFDSCLNTYAALASGELKDQNAALLVPELQNCNSTMPPISIPDVRELLDKLSLWVVRQADISLALYNVSTQQNETLNGLNTKSNETITQLNETIHLQSRIILYVGLIAVALICALSYFCVKNNALKKENARLTDNLHAAQPDTALESNRQSTGIEMTGSPTQGDFQQA